MIGINHAFQRRKTKKWRYDIWCSIFPGILWSWMPPGLPQESSWLFFDFITRLWDSWVMDLRRIWGNREFLELLCLVVNLKDFSIKWSKANNLTSQVKNQRFEYLIKIWLHKSNRWYFQFWLIFSTSIALWFNIRH